MPQGGILSDGRVAYFPMAVCKRLIAQLKKDNAFLIAAEKRRHINEPVTTPVKDTSRISAKGIRAMRKKLGVSQADFAKLAGVSMQIVGVWEQKDGALNMQKETRAAILNIRGIKRREALRRLEEMGDKKATVRVLKAVKGKRNPVKRRK